MKTIKTQISAKTRHLKAKWSIDIAKDMSVEYDGDLSKILQQEIDNEIMTDLLIKSGWHVVTPKTPNFIMPSIDMIDWCKENLVSDNWKNYGPTFLFKLEADAILFALKWI